MFQLNEQNKLVFIHGREAYAKAAQACHLCQRFKADDEDEHVSEVLESCYNCLYRRWTEESFTCMKQ